MFVRLLSSAALAAGFTAAPVQPGPVSPVTTLKYRVGVVVQSSIDFSGVGGGEQKNMGGFTGFFTMTLKDTTAGKALTMVLDSMQADSASPGQALAMLQGAADSSDGSTWHGLLTDTGRIDNLVFVQGGPGAQQFEAVLAGFFPRGAAHTRKQGDVWSDTLSFSSTNDEGSTALKTTTTFTGAGEAPFGGARALLINATSVVSSIATRQGTDTDVQVEGTGTGVGVYYVTREGRYLGGTNTIDSDLLITAAQAPAPIPLKAHTVVTVSAL